MAQVTEPVRRAAMEKAAGEENPEADHVDGCGTDEASPEADHDGEDIWPAVWKVAGDSEELNEVEQDVKDGDGTDVAAAGDGAVGGTAGGGTAGDSVETAGGGTAGNGGGSSGADGVWMGSSDLPAETENI